MKLNLNGKEQLNFFQSEDWIPLAYPAITRPIHYLGSKLRVVGSIVNVINSTDPSNGPVCDLFSGSGTVSRALSETRDVIASDVQEYSRVICSALLQPVESKPNTINMIINALDSSSHSTSLTWATTPLIEYEKLCINQAENGDLEPLCDLLENGSFIKYERESSNARYVGLISALSETYTRLKKLDMVDNPSAMVTRYFGGIYFSFKQSNQIDTILDAIEQLPHLQRDTYLAALLSTTSEIVNTIGKQFAQPLRPRTSSGKPKTNILQKVSQDRFKDVAGIYQAWINRYLAIPKTNRNHQVIKNDYLAVLRSLKGKVSIVYADPPYTRDHYSRYYHVLETICLRDNPKISTVRIGGRVQLSRGIYRVDRHQSDFCIKSKAPSAFEVLFSNVSDLNVPLVLSYSPFEENSRARPRLMTIDRIGELASKYFERVEISKAGNIAHQKLTSSDKLNDISYDSEVFIVCTP